MSNTKAKIEYIIAMCIYGTTAIFSRHINLSSGLIILSRSYIGMIVLLIFVKIIKRDKTDFKGIKNNLLYLILGGISLGLNWIFLFASYEYTTVAVSTVCNYLAPTILILISPFIFKTKLTLKKVLCVFIALIGMIFVSGVIGSTVGKPLGFVLGICGAFAYVGLIVFNKIQNNISVYDKVIIGLFFASLVMLPYALFTTDFKAISLLPRDIILTLVIGIVHTGIAYILYYGSMTYLDSQSISIFSYFEPVVSIILSVIILREKMTIFTIIGTVLILGATFISEINFKKRSTINLL